MKHPSDVPPELSALYEAERASPGAPAEARARLDERLLATLAPAAVAAPSAAAAGGASLTLKIVVGLALIGGVAGGALIFRTRPAPPPPVVAKAPEPRPAPPPPALPPPPQAMQPVVAPPPVPAKVTPARRPSRPERLAAEQALLDEAQARLQHGDAAGALELAARHASVYPGGALVEEREVLAIRALARAGRLDAARDRAAQFRVRFPDSIQLDVIDSVLSRAGQ